MQDAESKLIFVDSKGETRSLRGTVTVQPDGFVRVDRRDGSLLVPVARVLAIEAWTGEEVRP
jgi:hypothetical protein